MVNPNALRKAKIVCNFGLSECNSVEDGKMRILEFKNSVVPETAHDDIAWMKCFYTLQK